MLLSSQMFLEIPTNFPKVGLFFHVCIYQVFHIIECHCCCCDCCVIEELWLKCILGTESEKRSTKSSESDSSQALGSPEQNLKKLDFKNSM